MMQIPALLPGKKTKQKQTKTQQHSSKCNEDINTNTNISALPMLQDRKTTLKGYTQATDDTISTDEKEVCHLK